MTFFSIDILLVFPIFIHSLSIYLHPLFTLFLSAWQMTETVIIVILIVYCCFVFFFSKTITAFCYCDDDNVKKKPEWCFVILILSWWWWYDSRIINHQCYIKVEYQISKPEKKYEIFLLLANHYYKYYFHHHHQQQQQQWWWSFFYSINLLYVFFYNVSVRFYHKQTLKIIIMRMFKWEKKNSKNS